MLARLRLLEHEYPKLQAERDAAQRALALACKFIDDKLGSCPIDFDVFDFDECKMEECDSDGAACWQECFEKETGS
jgi:hypothetical protein